MFQWTERSSIPDYNHEMIHYRNSMVKEINFAFSDRYSNDSKNDSVLDEFERLKDQREKTANRLKRENQTNKVWFDLFIDLFRSTNDFTSADLYLKYFIIPNEAIFADFYFYMSDPNSTFKTLLKNDSYKEAFGFLDFFPVSDRLAEYGEMLRGAVNYGIHEAVLFILEHIHLSPYDILRKDDEIINIIKKQYLDAERNRRIIEAKKLADLLGNSDRINRSRALEAMLDNNVTVALEHIKKIVEPIEFHYIIREFYSTAFKIAKETESMDQYKIAFNYAYYSKLGQEDEKYLVEPASNLFEYNLSKLSATEMDYVEAEKYAQFCPDDHKMNILSKCILNFIKDNDRSKVNNLKDRFGIKFEPGSYSNEKEVRKYYQTLTETYGSYDIPKGEECLLTAKDLTEIFNFDKIEKDALRVKICRFYITNRLIDNAKKYFNAESKELKELVINQISTFINDKDFLSAYELSDSFEMKAGRNFKVDKVREIKNLTTDENNNEDLAKAIVIDHIFELKKLPKSFYFQTFKYGLESGRPGIELLSNLSIPFNRHMNACGKVLLNKSIKSLIASDKMSADILKKAYKKNTKPDFFDFIIYFIRKILGAC